jgi:hypothetical protein
MLNSAVRKAATWNSRVLSSTHYQEPRFLRVAIDRKAPWPQIQARRTFRLPRTMV